jgi:predicted membrane channel-forming protein YqfA (hemolysin III family)
VSLPQLASVGARDCEQSLYSGVAKMPLKPREEIVNGLIYLIGLIVVILFILSFLGLR